MTGLPIIPVAVGASTGWRLSSWDGFLVPKPFARVRLRYGPPYWIERESGEGELARHALALGRTLDEMSAAMEEGQLAPASPRGAARA